MECDGSGDEESFRGQFLISIEKCKYFGSAMQENGRILEEADIEEIYVAG